MKYLAIKCGGCKQTGQVTMDDENNTPINVLDGKFYIHERKYGQKRRKTIACGICQQTYQTPITSR